MQKTAKGRLADVTGKNANIDAESHYDDWADTYDSDLLNDYGYRAHKIAVDAFAKAAPDKSINIMDIGCGTGLVGAELAGFRYCAVDGLDVSAKMLAEAARRNVYRKLIHFNAETGQTPAIAAYDGVISVGTFGVGGMGPSGMGAVAAYAKAGGLVVLFMNSEPFIDMDFQAEIDKLCANGVWQIQAIEDHNYMDALERPGKLIVART